MGHFKYIGIEGPISGGKSTIARQIADALGPTTKLFLEPDEELGKDGRKRNPYLDAYYEETERRKDPDYPRPLASVAFLMQAHLCVGRAHIHTAAAAWVDACEGDAVVDRIVCGDASFALVQVERGLMSEDEFFTYSRLYKFIVDRTPLPSVVVNIQAKPATCIERIKRRILQKTGRACENVIEVDYLEHLQHEIDKMIGALRTTGVEIIDVDWNDDRDTPELRAPVVAEIVERIRMSRGELKFLDRHRKII